MHPDEERWWIEVVRRLNKLISVAQETHKAVDALSKRLNAAYPDPKPNAHCKTCGVEIHPSDRVCRNGHGQ